MKKNIASCLYLCLVIFLISGCKPTTEVSGDDIVNLDKMSKEEIGKKLIETMFVENDFQSAYDDFPYSETFHDELTADVLQNYVKQITDKKGKFIRILDAPKSQEVQDSQEGYERYNFMYDCTTSYGKFGLILNFDNTNKISSLTFWPAIDDTIIEKGEHISIGLLEMKLPGVLLMPSNDQADTLVIISAGSSLHDLNGTLGLNTIYKDIAQQVSAKGIAVYRYDKRDHMYADKMDRFMVTPFEDGIQDTILALRYFTNDKTHNFKNIYILGEGMGGHFLPKVYDLIKNTAPTNLKGLIYMSANASNYEDLMAAQMGLFAPKIEPSATQIESSATKDGPTVSFSDGSQGYGSFQQMLDEIKALTPQSAQNPQLLMGYGVYYYLYTKNYNPMEIAKSIEIPMLFLFGGNDKMLPQSEMVKWQDALGGMSNVQFKTYDGLDNYLMPQGNLTGSALNKVTVSTQVTDDISSWISMN